jgi:hypothetical protein
MMLALYDRFGFDSIYYGILGTYFLGSIVVVKSIRTRDKIKESKEKQKRWQELTVTIYGKK